MQQTRILMGMPVTINIVGPGARQAIFDRVFAYFEYVDEKFSIYKPYSEISLINQHAQALDEASYDMQRVFRLSEQFRKATGGYFNIQHTGKFDPSGLVKGWAISNAAEIIRQAGYANYYVDAGGDFQVEGKNSQGQNWRVGIRNPFNIQEIVKVLSVSGCGVATSGTYIRGQHIYNPVEGADEINDIASLTVIGEDVYEADCYATAAFAMGQKGIAFIEALDGFEGYMIDCQRQATFTSGFERYVAHVLD